MSAQWPPADALVEFLSARLAEDEQTARGAGGETWEPWANDIIVRDPEAIGGARNVLEVGYDGVPFRDEEVLHVVRWDPARVMAEIEAKRRTIAWAIEMIEGSGDWFIKDSMVVVLALMALAYADHPDYREEWRPEKSEEEEE